MIKGTATINGTKYHYLVTRNWDGWQSFAGIGEGKDFKCLRLGGFLNSTDAKNYAIRYLDNKRKGMYSR